MAITVDVLDRISGLDSLRNVVIEQQTIINQDVFIGKYKTILC